MTWGRRQLLVTVRGASGASEADGTEWYCVVSITNQRFETRALKLPGDLLWNETFLFSSHAINHTPHAATAAAVTAGAASTPPPAAPKLHLEVWVSKRWGSPSIHSWADLPLGPLIPLLTSTSSTITTQTVLLEPIRKPAGRSAKQAPPGMFLQLDLVAAPEPQLGPTPAEGPGAPPSSTASSQGGAAAAAAGGGSGSWSTTRQVLATHLQLMDAYPVLHTQLGHLYRSPPVQVLKVTLRSAGDLHNLLIDPQGAAAAAAAGQGFSLRLAAIAHPLAGGSSSGGGGVVAEGLAGLSAAADAANMARQRVQDMTSNGQAAARSLLANTKAWFKDRKPSSAAAAARKAELGQSSGRLSPIPDSTPPSPRHPLIATTAAAGGSRPVTPEPGGATGSGSSDRGAATAAAAAAGGGPVVVQAGDATPSPRSIAGSSPVPGDFLTKGSGSGSGTAPLLDSRDGTEQGLGAAAGGSQQLEGGSPRVQGGSPLPGPSPLGLLRSSMDSNFNSSPTAAQASSSRFEDPGPGPAHARIPSVDADAVMSMLEDNGFHASDAPGGNFFYMRVTCGEEAGVSRMVGLGPSGDAVWGQVFWFALPRPAPADAQLALELYSSRDNKSRGRCVMRVVAAVGDLLDPAAAAPGSTPDHFRGRHQLTGSFSVNLNCTVCIDVEAVDTDTRAAHLPRAAPPGTTQPKAAAGEEEPPGAPDPGEDLSDWGAAAAAGLRRRTVGTITTPASPPSHAAAAAAAGGAAGGSPGAGGSSLKSPASAGAAAGSSSPIGLSPPPLVLPPPLQLGPSESDAAPLQPLPSVAALELVVKGFDLHKPLDCFWVLQLGPYWAVSSDAHSTSSPAWYWALVAPVADSSWVLSLEVFRREGLSGGKKVVTVKSMFGDGVKPLGRIKVRLCSLLPNEPIHVSLPMQGERHNARGGRVGTATAHLSLHLRVPALVKGYLPHLFKIPMHPPLFLLLNGHSPATLDSVTTITQRVGTRWLEGCHPALPAALSRCLLDDGRSEFTLSRTRHNWRRLLALRDLLTPAGAWLEHVCSWRAPGHSLGVYLVILLLGAYPSAVLSLACAGVVALLLHQAWRRGRVSLGSPPTMEPDLGEPADLAAGTAVPTDPYTALKQNYDGVVTFLMTVQNVLDGWAAAGERLHLLLTWRDPVATACFLGVLCVLCLGLAVIGLRVLVTFGLLWVFRHPALRIPYTPPPAAFALRLPTRRDTTV